MNKAFQPLERELRDCQPSRHTCYSCINALEALDNVMLICKRASSATNTNMAFEDICDILINAGYDYRFL